MEKTEDIEYRILGCEVTDSKDLLPLALVQDETVKR